MIKVRAENISKVFPNKSRGPGSIALSGINLQIKDGEFFAIIGPSGRLSFFASGMKLERQCCS